MTLNKILLCEIDDIKCKYYQKLHCVVEWHWQQ